MKIGIMQPYFIPYIGYWQLMNAVDKYVIYDDVNFIKGGWINRNRILVNGEAKYFNVQMQGASPHKLINEVQLNNNEKVIKKNLRIIEGAYQKAPFYNDIFPLIEKIIRCDKENISDYITESFKVICEYLEINTELIKSSELDKDSSLRGQDKVISICKLLNATEYYNAIGGRNLYSFKTFEDEQIKLKFLETLNIEYKQFNNDFQSNLSIIDVLMFNNKKTVQEFLDAYTLIDK